MLPRMRCQIKAFCLMEYKLLKGITASQEEIYLKASISSVQSLSRVWLFATPWITARQASLSITNSRSSPKLMSIELVMPSSHLILCRPLLLLPPVPPSIRVFSNESTLRMRWPKYWSFSFSISPSKEHPGLIFFRMDWLGGIYGGPIIPLPFKMPSFLIWIAFVTLWTISWPYLCGSTSGFYSIPLNCVSNTVWITTPLH